MPQALPLFLTLLLAACAGPGPGVTAESAPPGAAAKSTPSGGAASGGAGDPSAGAPPREVTLVRAFPRLAFASPTDLQAPADGTGRLFVVEQAGTVRAFPNEPDVATAAIFLDLRAKVASGGEMGLLGLAFHPQFRTNRQFYVNYTANGPRRTVVSRFTARADDPGQADPASEAVVLTFDQPYANHNGGQLAFGPDGFLYIGTGDGGSGGDPHGNGQNVNTVLGKLLRIDVDHPAGGRAYGIPADNPFAAGGGRPEVFAWGLRNLWRFSFDPDTGRIWGADVGQSRLEEVDLLEKGKNYGWNVMEGSSCFRAATCDPSPYVLPVAEYGRDEGVSITGGYVYRGKRVPPLVGQYVYADYGSGKVWALPDGGKPRLLVDSELNPSTFGVDAERELYLADHGGGGLWRLSGR